MALPASGNISVSQIQTEFSVASLSAAASPASLTLPVSATQFYGKSAQLNLITAGVPQYTVVQTNGEFVSNWWTIATTSGAYRFSISHGGTSQARIWAVFDLVSSILSSYTTLHIDHEVVGTNWYSRRINVTHATSIISSFDFNATASYNNNINGNGQFTRTTTSVALNAAKTRRYMPIGFLNTTASTASRYWNIYNMWVT